jgi:trehalose 6-phosphate synthase
MNSSPGPLCKPDEGTIVIVSNRGPHDFVWEDGQWVAKAAAGGLMSMIKPLARQPNVAWFCCVSEPPGSEEERDALYTTAKDQTDPDLNVVPVPLPAGLYQDYYGVISNQVLWMLQHHLVGEFGYSSLDARRHAAWESYQEANRRMAQGIVDTEIPPRAFIIQDYHLYPLPELLRARFPGTPCLHFTHIPFPDPAVLKLLPHAWRGAMLRGLLGADIVGFQTSADVRSFLACCEEVLGEKVDHKVRSVQLAEGRTVRARAYPASTDPEVISATAASPEIAAARAKIAPETRELNIIRIDRLDPSKNQVLGFTAFGRLLELHPELHGRVRFLTFFVPSRTDLTIYRGYRDAVYAEIEAVNARFRQSCGFDPIRVFYTNERAQSIAAMELADVLLVNSRQDGMNLVVKEWALFSQRPGVLVLSETAGVAEEAGVHALLVCPLDVEGTAQALSQALTMPREERLARIDQLRSGIRSWTSRNWLEAQLQDLGITLSQLPAREPLAVAQPGVFELELKVLNRSGIHARPAAAFVRCAREFECAIEIIREDQSFSAKSILEVLTANLNHEAMFILRATGPDAEVASFRMAELLASFEQTEE